jgi:hypothetical protein
MNILCAGHQWLRIHSILIKRENSKSGFISLGSKCFLISKKSIFARFF